MATQGVVSLVDDRGKTIIKTIVGCNGYNADKLVAKIRRYDLQTMAEVYDAAREIEFGCDDCRVVMNSEQYLFVGDDDLSPLYRQTFDQPEFNPRWEHGTADYTRTCLHIALTNRW